MTTPSRSLRCRHCRADNPADATRCWLCDAADWRPPAGKPGQFEEPSSAHTFGLGAGCELAVMALGQIFIILMLVTGMAKLGPGVAIGPTVALGVVGWLSIGYVLVHNRRDRPGALSLAFILSGLAVVMTIALAVYLFNTCAARWSTR
jgi:hypothetical protein